MKIKDYWLMMSGKNLTCVSVVLLLIALFLPKSALGLDSNDSSAIQVKNNVEIGDSFSIPRSHSVKLSDGDRPYKLYIKLPKGYGANKNLQKRYPVIYMTDAMYSFQIVSGATRFPMNAGYMQQAILVGISWELGTKGSMSRIRDYTPSKDPSWRKTTGEASRHKAFIRHKVIPYIEQHYRAEPTERTFVGNSLGGLLGAYILLGDLESISKGEMRSRGLFESYVLGSPSLWFHNKQLLNQFADNKMQLGRLTSRVFVGIGELETPKGGGARNDMVSDAKVFAQLLSEGRSSELTKLLIIPEAKHATAFPTTAAQGLYWLYQ